MCEASRCGAGEKRPAGVELKVGVIGCGAMGSNLARNCAALAGAKISATADVEEKRARQLAEELNAECFRDYRELLGGAVDAVIVAVPNLLHAEVSATAAKAGKHVFCEKPMALSVAECDAMIEAARRRGVALMIGQSERYDPVFAKAKEIVDSGLIGEPFSIHVERIDGIDWGAHGAAWRRRRKMSGGMLFHCNVHEVDYMRYVCGDVDRVSALMSKNVAEDIDYEDTAHVQLHFRSGAIGTLVAGHCSALPGIGGKVHCTKGTVHFWRQEAVTYNTFGGEPVHIPAEEIEAEPAVRRELREFVESARKGEPPTIRGEEGRKVVEVIEAAYRAAAEGREVAIEAR